MHNAKWQAVWLTLSYEMVVLLTFYSKSMEPAVAAAISFEPV